MADSGPSVQGLASEWDGIPTVRDRLRGGRGLDRGGFVQECRYSDSLCLQRCAATYPYKDEGCC